MKEKDLIIKRPALGIRSRFYNSVLGSKVRTNIKKNEPINWNNSMSKVVIFGNAEIASLAHFILRMTPIIKLLHSQLMTSLLEKIH